MSHALEIIIFLTDHKRNPCSSSVINTFIWSNKSHPQCPVSILHNVHTETIYGWEKVLCSSGLMTSRSTECEIRQRDVLLWLSCFCHWNLVWAIWTTYIALHCAAPASLLLQNIHRSKSSFHVLRFYFHLLKFLQKHYLHFISVEFSYKVSCIITSLFPRLKYEAISLFSPY